MLPGVLRDDVGRAEGRAALAVSSTSSAVLALRACCRDRRASPPASSDALGQPDEIDRAGARMQVEQALAELGHLGEAAGDGDPRHRMAAQVFQHAAGEVAHVDQGMLGQAVEALHRRLGGRARGAGDMGRGPPARATSMPRWIEWIQAAQE